MNEAKRTEEQQSARDQIREKWLGIRELRQEIDDIAKSHIPEFFFLDHQVSDFWSNCDDSPIGYCVWDISKRGFHIDVQCHFCKNPVERK